ncbi:heavy metal-binding domain-containing protein [Parasediminibacterium sp. JCM 36343]|uniref:heavy metal-binding domain-containing protein n=1 Tax=Parasediminibacterium sp. JCM 36343 TaxID=3374279 RepID=UPI00397BCF86
MKTMKILMMAVLTILSVTVFAQIKGGRKDTMQHTKYYTCPKHDTIAMKLPGNCPICGMKLNLSKKEAAKIAQSKTYICPSHPTEVSDKPGKCSVCGMNLNLSAKEKAKLGYTCPMHPSVRIDKDGKCPKCGMALTPVKKNS